MSMMPLMTGPAVRPSRRNTVAQPADNEDRDRTLPIAPQMPKAMPMR